MYIRSSSPLLIATLLMGCASANVADADHNVYPVITIGSQQWLGANLRVTHAPSGSFLVTHAPNDDSSAAKRFGMLYDWASAKQACMRGWHLPSDAEWEALSTTLGPRAGGALKDTVQWLRPNVGATNRVRFGARGTGYWNGGEFENQLGRIAVYWSSTAADTHFVWKRALATADEHRVLDVHRIDDRANVVGEGRHGPRSAIDSGGSMTRQVDCNDTKTVGERLTKKPLGHRRACAEQRRGGDG